METFLPRLTSQPTVPVQEINRGASAQANQPLGTDRGRLPQRS